MSCIRPMCAYLGLMTTIPVLRLDGAIMPPGRQGGLNAAGLEPLLSKAFANKRTKAVALSINCPGGSPVQSSLIARRIRQLADRHQTPVLAFVEDVAASGGYWLAAIADEIYADPSSLLGSIGVISAGFGFDEAIDRLGISRRAHTAGKNKMRLDPFQPEKAEDVTWLKTIQGQIHEEFRAHIRACRGSKLKADEDTLMNGEVWLGRQALELGLIDGLGTLPEVLKDKFGKKVKLKPLKQRRSLFSRFPFMGASVEGALASVEERALFSRYGL